MSVQMIGQPPENNLKHITFYLIQGLLTVHIPNELNRKPGILLPCLQIQSPVMKYSFPEYITEMGTIRTEITLHGIAFHRYKPLM